MLASVSMLLAGLTWMAPPQAPGGPAVAVMRLQARGGVTQDAAQLLSEYMVAQVRSSNAFSRVVSPTEIEAIITLEQTRQLLNCADVSCWAEVSGALGVDYVLIGSVGRVGAYVLINTSLVKVDNATAVSKSTKVCAQKEDQLVNAVDPLLAVTLADVGLLPRNSTAQAELAALGRCDGTAAVASQGGPATTTPLRDNAGGAAAGGGGPGSGSGFNVWRVLGGGLAAGGVAGLGVAVVAGLLGALWLAAIRTPALLGNIPTGSLTYTRRVMTLYGTFAGLSGVGVLLGVLALGALATGGALLVVSLWN